MSREIKFRVWDGTRNEMRQGVNILICSHTGRPQWQHGYNEPEPMHDAKLLQFTGLKDANGVEIYEGDIVRLGDNPIHEGTLVECQFSQSRAQWIYSFLTGQHKGKATDMVDTWRSYTIVGNIFENPELAEAA
ncbi:MAG: YopX family protein [Pseudomonadota bacterium]